MIVDREKTGNESAVKRRPYCNRKAKEEDSKPCVIVLKLLFEIFFHQTSPSLLKTDPFVKDLKTEILSDDHGKTHASAWERRRHCMAYICGQK